MQNIPKNFIFLSVIIFSLFLVSCSKSVKQSPKPNESIFKTSASNVLASSIGIGSSGNPYFDFSDPRDLAVPMDYCNSGISTGQQILCYRPGAGVVYIFANNGGTTPHFIAVYLKSGTGIGAPGSNYNLNDSRDRIIPYDAYGTGKLDHLICYRPGTGAFWIFACGGVKQGEFNPILQSSFGVGTPSIHYDLSDNRDILVPFDFYSTGKATQLLCYRPGTGICWVLNNTNPLGMAPNFVPVYQTNIGIGTNGPRYDLSDNRDLILPFDVNHLGKKDGLLCYRPGTGIIYLIGHTVSGGFQALGTSNIGITDPTTGLRYDLSSNADRIINYDFFSNGSTNNPVAYRPGVGVCYMYSHVSYSPVYGLTVYNDSDGIGIDPINYDLTSPNDKVFSYDFDGFGKIDHLVAYRPGLKAFWVFNNSLQKIF